VLPLMALNRSPAEISSPLGIFPRPFRQPATELTARCGLCVRDRLDAATHVSGMVVAHGVGLATSARPRG
jgi:hypothetical protein